MGIREYLLEPFKDGNNKMKYIIIFIFLLVFLSCTGRPQWQCGGEGGAIKSTAYDKRCDKFFDEAKTKAKETGVCHSGPLTPGLDPGAIDPDPEACEAIGAEARKKCSDLGPPGPGDLVYTSGSAIFEGKNPVMINGKPVCR